MIFVFSQCCSLFLWCSPTIDPSGNCHCWFFSLLAQVLQCWDEKCELMIWRIQLNLSESNSNKHPITANAVTCKLNKQRTNLCTRSQTPEDILQRTMSGKNMQQEPVWNYGNSSHPIGVPLGDHRSSTQGWRWNASGTYFQWDLDIPSPQPFCSPYHWWMYHPRLITFWWINMAVENPPLIDGFFSK